MYVRHTSQLILSEFLPLLQRNLDSPDHVLTHLCAKCVTVLTVHFASDNVALLLLRCPHKTAVKALSLLFETSGHCIVAPTRVKIQTLGQLDFKHDPSYDFWLHYHFVVDCLLPHRRQSTAAATATATAMSAVTRKLLRTKHRR